jgi:uncharacterized membrane protein
MTTNSVQVQLSTYLVQRTEKIITYFHHLLLHHANIADQGYELCNSSFKFCLFYLISNGTFALSLILGQIRTD